MVICSCYNIAAARAVDREFNYNFGSNLGLLGSRRGSNRRGAPVGFIWADFRLKRSHGDPFRDQHHVFVRPVKCVFFDQLLFGTDKLLLGTDPLLLGTDQLHLGTDQWLVGSDH